jgi:cysteine desulfurase family protein (TIGR01976 family)
MVDGVPAIYADGPGGTQVPESVVDAMAGFMRVGGSNLGGPFATSRETDVVVAEARSAMADFLGADPGEIAFGQNMTSLNLALARALSRDWGPGDELVVTALDHDANVSPWLIAAEETGATIRLVPFDVDTGMLDLETLDRVLGEHTRYVAVSHASNAIGSVVDVAEVTRRAHAVGALVGVDAVHYAPHGPIDVRRIDCDFLLCSSYKFFGPHTGIMYGKAELLASVEPYKIRPAPSDPPGKWETGTQSFESMAGVTAAVDYLASLGEGDDRRSRIVDAMTATSDYERTISRRFIDAVESMDHVDLYGSTDPGHRTPTFAIDVHGMTPDAVASALGRQGIFVWSGHYYALEAIDQLGRSDVGGLVRIGFVHYNTLEEVDRTLAALERLG